jgi:hypothetical protein
MQGSSGGGPVRHTVSFVELNEQLERIHRTWKSAGLEDRKAEVEQLHTMLEELWRLQSQEALELRRRVRSMIDESEHPLRGPGTATLPR